MDEDLRRLERGDDPLAYATALRRAGDDVRARRVVEARVRAGDAAAREVLDAWWPVDERVLRVVARGQRDDLWTVPFWLYGEEDPRLTPAIESVLARLEFLARRVPNVATFITLMRRPTEERRRDLVNDTLDARRLSRARLDADEAAALFARALPMPRVDGPTFLLSAIWHVVQARSVRCAVLLRQLICCDDPLVAWSVARALDAIGRPTTAPGLMPSLLLGHAFSPARGLDRCPAESRDWTGAFERSAFVDDPLAPLESDVARDAPLEGCLLSVCFDRPFRGMDPRKKSLAILKVTGVLQTCVGDRVAGRKDRDQEWLIRLEPDNDPLPIAEGLRAAVAATGVTVSIGIAPGSTWATSIAAAQSARFRAEREGGDRVRFAP